MGPSRKSTTNLPQEETYPAVLQKLCKEEDVLIIPVFVTHFTAKKLGPLSPRKLKEFQKRSSASLSNRELKEDFALYEDGPPPKVYIGYEDPEVNNTPLSIMCKNMYIEFAFINAIGKSIKQFKSLNTLKIENCCISKEIVESLAQLLTEEHGISDLILDGNEGLGKVLPLLLNSPTGLENLSLERCSLNDEDIGLLSETLGFSDQKNQKLATLNLSMNRIGDLGAKYLANALRTNRTLVSLALAGNYITDEGVSYFIEALMKFKLTFEEVMMKRRRIFDQIIGKKKALEKLLEARKEKPETPLPSKSGEEYVTTVKKVRGPDGKTRCIATRDKRVRSSQQILRNSEEKIQKLEREKSLISKEPSPIDIEVLQQEVEDKFPPDMHPLVNEIEFCEDGFYCAGCWSMNNLNLAYNNITLKSVEEFLKVFKYQKRYFHPPKYGLHRLVLKNKLWDKEETYETLEKKINKKYKEDIVEENNVQSIKKIIEPKQVFSKTEKIVKEEINAPNTNQKKDLKW